MARRNPPRPQAEVLATPSAARRLGTGVLVFLVYVLISIAVDKIWPVTPQRTLSSIYVAGLAGAVTYAALMRWLKVAMAAMVVVSVAAGLLFYSPTSWHQADHATSTGVEKAGTAGHDQITKVGHKR